MGERQSAPKKPTCNLVWRVELWGRLGSHPVHHIVRHIVRKRFGVSRAFDINAAVTSVEVQAGSEVVVVFPVTNRLGRQVDTRLQLLADSGPHGGWLSVQGETVRPLKAEETDTVQVRVLVPAGQSPATYTFHLLASSVANPEGDFGDGP